MHRGDRDWSENKKAHITEDDLAVADDKVIDLAVTDDRSITVDDLIPPLRRIRMEKEEENPSTEEDLEMELTGHLQHLVEEVDDEKELVYTLQQLADNVKHEKRTHAVLSRVIRNNLCEDIAKAIEKVDCISTLEWDLMEDIPSSQVMEKIIPENGDSI